jgi:hypothetical protein
VGVRAAVAWQIALWQHLALFTFVHALAIAACGTMSDDCKLIWCGPAGWLAQSVGVLYVGMVAHGSMVGSMLRCMFPAGLKRDAG